MTGSKGVVTIDFFDVESQDDACIALRRSGDEVGICVSLRHGAAAEVFMPPDVVERLVRVLQELGRRRAAP